MTGYSRTPLVKKRGVKKGSRLLLVDAPPAFEEELKSLSPGAIFAPDPADHLDLMLLFVRREEGLRERFAECTARFAPHGDAVDLMAEERASKVPINPSFDVVQQIVLQPGW